MGNKVSIISLGCAKNQVDAEHMLHSLHHNGFEVVDDPSNADAVIINTCGFLESARSEAIENILEVASLKPDGQLKSIIVSGCMAQMLGDEIAREMPEVDVVIGLSGANNIVEVVKRALNQEKFVEVGKPEDIDLEGARILGNEPYYAYLKIADGCDNCCSYCAIPRIRGHFRSRPMENLIKEAKKLASVGVVELNVIAQDVTRYGEDLYGERKLPELLQKLCEIEELHWIRVLYAYPDRITDELLDVMNRESKIVKYLDLPLQHADGRILATMNRRGDDKWLSALIEKIRSRVPGIAIRTTFIAGLPGEDEAAFETLCRFVKNMRFDRLGVFPYSREEGTPAYDMDKQVDEDTKEHRAELIMQEQYYIAEEKNNEKIGSTLEVLVEGYDDYIKMHFGRSQFDAPEVDGKVFFTSDKKLKPGTFVQVAITDVLEYDLMGHQI